MEKLGQDPLAVVLAFLSMYLVAVTAPKGGATKNLSFVNGGSLTFAQGLNVDTFFVLTISTN